MNWYVLYVTTGAEEEIVFNLKKKLDNKTYIPFVPKKVFTIRRKGIISKKRKILYPGYIFFKSKNASEVVRRDIYRELCEFNKVYRFLSYGEKSEIVMHHRERELLEQLMDEDFCIDTSRGVIEEGKLKINSGPLSGFENTIKKVNRHTREALIETRVMGGLRKIIVDIEIEKR